MWYNTKVAFVVEIAIEGGFMEEVRGEIRGFFEEYERFTNLDDAGGIVAQFAENFMMADAAGARVISAGDLAAGIAKRKRLFEDAGSRSTSLVSLETRELSDRYVLAETEWLVRFEKGEVPLKSSFVVHRSDERPRIVFYLVHQNPVSVLKERGLLG
jgi:hypothetical protein